MVLTSGWQGQPVTWMIWPLGQVTGRVLHPEQPQATQTWANTVAGASAAAAAAKRRTR